MRHSTIIPTNIAIACGLIGIHSENKEQDPMDKKNILRFMVITVLVFLPGFVYSIINRYAS